MPVARDDLRPGQRINVRGSNCHLSHDHNADLGRACRLEETPWPAIVRSRHARFVSVDLLSPSGWSGGRFHFPYADVLESEAR